LSSAGWLEISSVSRCKLATESLTLWNWLHLTDGTLWTENPANCASRGLFPSELLVHELWWNGPRWFEIVI
jgi:hypothetical protein